MPKLGIGLGIGRVVAPRPTGGGGSYTASAVHLDGTTWGKVASLSGITTSPLLSFSGWFKVPVNDSNPHAFFDFDALQEALSADLIADGSMTFSLADDSFNTLNCNGTAGSFGFDSDWHHLFGYTETDKAAGFKTLVYQLDGVDVTGSINDTSPSFSMIFNGKPFNFPDDPDNGFPLVTGDLADWWIAPGVLHTDITTFRDATTHKPKNPSGFPAAAFMLSGDHTAFFSNTLGTAGALTLQAGALTDADSSPST